MQSIIDILHKNFQEDHTNSRRFPGFPGVVDTPNRREDKLEIQTDTKHTSKEKQTTQNTAKNYSGLVMFYETRPGNEVD